MRNAPRSAITTAFTLMVTLTIAACAEGPAASWQGTVTDSAGIEVVNNTGRGTWGSDAAWTVATDLVIGTADGEPEYQFGQISGMDVDSRGRIYVMDQQAREVRIFGPDGRFLDRIGKAGSGPGEFSQAAGPLFVGPDDVVTVPDAGLQRVNRFSAAGEAIGSYPLPMTEGIPTRWVEAPDQSLVQQAMIMQFPGQEEVEPKNLILRRAPTGEVADTVMTLPIGGTVRFSGNQPSITLFESEPVWTLGQDDRLYFGNNSEFRIEAFSSDGQLEQVIQRPFERRTVTEGDQEKLRRIIREVWERQGMPPQAMEQMSQVLRFADFYPAYANMMGGPDGTLWVQGIQTPETVEEQGGSFNIQDLGSADWEVYDDQGRLLGVVHMPPRFTPFFFHEDRIYGLLMDDLDVQYAARLTLLRGPAGRAD